MSNVYNNVLSLPVSARLHGMTTRTNIIHWQTGSFSRSFRSFLVVSTNFLDQLLESIQFQLTIPNSF
jgi:hypothetical protein